MIFRALAYQIYTERRGWIVVDACEAWSREAPCRVWGEQLSDNNISQGRQRRFGDPTHVANERPISETYPSNPEINVRVCPTQT